MDLLLRVLCAYLLGSVNGALLVGRLAGGVDIRTQGSGNAGGTNALRTQGPKFALAVIVIDIAKGWLAATWLGSLPLVSLSPSDPAAAAATLAWSPAACAFAAILGHVWPVFHGFRGGKGVATLVGAVAGLVPAFLPGVLGTWLLMMLLFGFVGLASIVAAASLPVMLALAVPGATPLVAFGVACALLVAWTHRGNLQRMRQGREPRSRRLWLLGRLRGGSGA
ncbi:MAG: glycerol-3-phosphate 1-O-acyltransferase PlsY [Steroidobacteraceae bacterium]|jgi:glycerol-3-phosphate acyltransferase PlsY|nr:glycerol-3-phosphate 1-O-acyltransferase PlsY [Steroidobacteraceae bacterium]